MFAGGGATGRVLRSGLAWLPRGQSLSEDVWRVRHRTLTFLLRAHVVGVFLFGVVVGRPLFECFQGAGAVAVFAILASTNPDRRKFVSGMTAVGLVTSSAALVGLSGGVIEMHFHFFVMVGILTLYQDWLPFLMAIGFVVLHHGVFGALDPSAVYDHADAVAHPFKWALIHGGFVLAASAASVVAWRLNEEQAFRDSLTHLPNRALFQDRVGHALTRSGRHPGALAVLFIDLDGFKGVNDSLGHAAGDALLCTVSERLKACVRPADTVARLGGDEFAVLLEDLTSEADATRIADRLLHAVAVPFNVAGRDITVTASVGIAFNHVPDTVDDLL
ncbi:MAG TPA: GGDEF domain-containing protein, partial [Acidimicrobiia bacterium]|nr:GGDEF domain-containing protein [Acidimicrobiia bacterium]